MRWTESPAEPGSDGIGAGGRGESAGYQERAGRHSPSLWCFYGPPGPGAPKPRVLYSPARARSELGGGKAPKQGGIDEPRAPRSVIPIRGAPIRARIVYGCLYMHVRGVVRGTTSSSLPRRRQPTRPRRGRKHGAASPDWSVDPATSLASRFALILVSVA